MQDVFSIGDCSGFLESTGKPTLPALAQVSYLSMNSFCCEDISNLLGKLLKSEISQMTAALCYLHMS
jgi:NADH dehydrogenase FAD-containing subunit